MPRVGFPYYASEKGFPTPSDHGLLPCLPSPTEPTNVLGLYRGGTHEVWRLGGRMPVRCIRDVLPSLESK